MRIRVVGPAYLDRVLLLDGPLLPVEGGGPVDRSASGRIEAAEASSLDLVDGRGRLRIEPLPDGWPGPRGRVRIESTGRALPPDGRLAGVAWHDDLGGMGAGFAGALGGELTCVLGGDEDPVSRAVAELLDRHKITSNAVRRERHSADWTLLVTSGGFGDKLPIGFRGILDGLSSETFAAEAPCDLLVVASLTNRLAAAALGSPASIRVFAPSLRNMLDRDPPVSAFAEQIDVLCCNRIEWEALADREAVADRLALLSITDGPRGSVVRYRGPGRAWREAMVPAWPRSRPPRDTNRAGEAYASTLLSALLAAGWTPGPVDGRLVEDTARRASAAAALVLDRDRFGFPTPAEIDAALAAGRVG